MTVKELEEAILNFDNTRYTKLQDYYNGKSDIVNRQFNDTTKPNNKIVNNYAGYIIDIIQGYFMGNPIQYSSQNNEYMQAVQNVLDANNSTILDTQISKQVGIKGKCYEIVFINELGEIKLAKVNAENMFTVYSDDIIPKLISAVRVWKSGEITNFEHYTAETITKGEIKKGKLSITDESLNFFGEVPIIEYINNDEQLGDFEKVISLIDAYDKSRSDTTNDLEYFTDAYLLLKGCAIDSTADADGIAKMKNNRLLELPADGNAEFLIKNINDVALENHNNRLRQDIHKFTMTPDMTDEDFGGNISGIALQFKMFGLEQITQTKENFMRDALKKRLRLITRILNIKGAQYNENEIIMTFNRNLPTNIAEKIASMISLRGLISDSTIISNLGIVDDVAYEIEKRDAENIGFETIDKAIEGAQNENA